MIYYYGRDLLNQLTAHYSVRFATAREKGLADTQAKYHWLYLELEYRLKLLREAALFMDTLPQYLPQGKPDDVLAYVTQYVGTWFKEQNMGPLPQDAAGHCQYFTDTNPYWAAISEVLGNLESKSDFEIIPLFHLNLCEYIIRNIRLYFYVREKQYRPIDRDKFDELMTPDIIGGSSA